MCLVAWGGVWPWFLVEGAWLWGRPTGRDEIVPTSFAERKGSGLALPDTAEERAWVLVLIKPDS